MSNSEQPDTVHARLPSSPSSPSSPSDRDYVHNRVEHLEFARRATRPFATVSGPCTAAIQHCAYGKVLPLDGAAGGGNQDSDGEDRLYAGGSPASQWVDSDLDSHRPVPSGPSSLVRRPSRLQSSAHSASSSDPAPFQQPRLPPRTSNNLLTVPTAAPLKTSDPKQLLSRQKPKLYTGPTTSATVLDPLSPTATSAAGDVSREPLSNSDPYLLKVIALTNAALPSPQPSPAAPARKSSFLYSPDAAAVVGSNIGGSSGPTLLKPPNAPESDASSMDRGIGRVVPTAQTVSRATRAKLAIAQRYALIMHAVSMATENAHSSPMATSGSRGASVNGYNPLAVIRFRREAWQAAVKANAPARDVRKLRMLRGGWGVGVDEFEEFLRGRAAALDARAPAGNARGSLNSAAEDDQFHESRAIGPTSSSAEVSPQHQHHARLSGVFSHNVMDISSTDALKPTASMNSDTTSPPSTVISPAQAATSADPSKSTSFTPAISTETQASTSTSGREKHNTQTVLKRLRNGTDALNAMLGKSVPSTRNRSHSNSMRTVSVGSRDHAAQAGGDASAGGLSSPQVDSLLETDPKLLTLFLSGHFGSSLSPPSASTAKQTSPESPSTFAGADSASEDVIEPPPLLSAQVGPAGNRDVRSGGRIAGRISVTNATRGILRSGSPERARLMDELQHWIVGSGPRDGEEASESGRPSVAVAESARRRPGTPRRSKKAIVERSSKTRMEDKEDEDEESTDSDMPKPTPFKSKKASRKEGKKETNAFDLTEMHVNHANIFRIPRPGKKKKDRSVSLAGILESERKNSMLNALLGEEPSVSGEYMSPAEESEGKKLEPLDRKETKSSSARLSPIPSVEAKNSFKSRDKKPVERRRSAKIQMKKKSNSTLGTQRSEHSRRSSNRFSSDLGSRPESKSERASKSSSTSQKNDVEAQFEDVARSVSHLLSMILSSCVIRQTELKAKLDSYNSIIDAFNVVEKVEPFSEEYSMSASHLTVSVIPAKFLTHEVQVESLRANLEKLNSTITGILGSFEEGNERIKTMILETDGLGVEINERSSRRLKAVEDAIQHREVVRNGTMNTVMEVLYQCLEALLIVVGYMIWLVYKGAKLVQRGYEAVAGTS
ncbi:hypothetical protein HDU84_003691 [Entophlyctis sp. JEL0112]|nr:hypothetical protein HDU84_003691 [Entophlyctis sp. JEL0112]